MGKITDLLKKKTPPPTTVTRPCGCQTVDGLPSKLCPTDMKALDR
ncbi:hypothetical protein [Herbidospora daliensis]|nr:hypothetical protein [Herbidospora daliensis]